MRLTLLLLVAVALQAQTTHSVALTVTDTLNPSGTTYSIYRAPGLCSGTPVFAKIASALTVKTYEDTTVQPGNYCYAATATFQGSESPQSPTFAAQVPSFAPSQLSGTVK